MSTTDKPMHTPTPWKLLETDDYDRVCIVDADGFAICISWAANAAHIVRCVNSHDALVEALTNAILKMGNAARLMGSSDEAIESLLEPYRAALKLAKCEK